MIGKRKGSARQREGVEKMRYSLGAADAGELGLEKRNVPPCGVGNDDRARDKLFNLMREVGEERRMFEVGRRDAVHVAVSVRAAVRFDKRADLSFDLAVSGSARADFNDPITSDTQSCHLEIEKHERRLA